jgi:hypothetical protein
MLWSAWWWWWCRGQQKQRWHRACAAVTEIRDQPVDESLSMGVCCTCHEFCHTLPSDCGRWQMAAVIVPWQAAATGFKARTLCVTQSELMRSLLCTESSCASCSTDRSARQCIFCLVSCSHWGGHHDT